MVAAGGGARSSVDGRVRVADPGSGARAPGSQESAPIASVRVVAPSLSRRFSGVTASIIAVAPPLARSIPVRVLARGMPSRVPSMGWGDLFRHCRDGRWRVWHARRNIEMLAGVVLRALLRFRFVLVFTSAAQRRHTRYTRWLYSKMDRVVATTSAAAAFLDRPATVVRHGVDVVVFHPPADRAAEWRARGGWGDRGLAVFGRVRPNKGTGDLVDALCAVLPAHPSWGAVIVGKSTPKHAAFREALEEQVRAAGLGERVRFVGEVEDFAEIPGWYRAATLVVAPPWVEGFGLTVLEAMASGCAVVATRTGAFPEVVVEGETGWLAPCRDPAALATALGDALSDPVRLEEMGRRGRARVEADFTIEREAAELAAIYEEELARYGGVGTS